MWHSMPYASCAAARDASARVGAAFVLHRAARLRRAPATRRNAQQADRHAPSACARMGSAPGSPRRRLGTRKTPSPSALGRAEDGAPWRGARLTATRTLPGTGWEGPAFWRSPAATRGARRHARERVALCPSSPHPLAALQACFDRARVRTVSPGQRCVPRWLLLDRALRAHQCWGKNCAARVFLSSARAASGRRCCTLPPSGREVL